MSHPHIETLIFTDGPLAPGQEDELHAHLQGCGQCMALYLAWTGVSGHLATPRMAAPAPGFNLRWESTLNQHKARVARRQSWVVLILIGLASLFVLFFLGSQVRLVYDSPAAFMVDIGGRAGDVFSAMSVVVEILESLSRAAPGIFLAGLWATFAVLSLMSLLWLVSISQFILQRRIIK